MAEYGLNDAMIRDHLRDIVRHLKNGVYLSCMAKSGYAQAIIWASERIAELEGQTQSPETDDDENRDVFLTLEGGDSIMSPKNCKALEWAQIYLMELERENENLSKTILTLSKSPQLASSESEEEIYERRRRERLLDEITLICVSKEVEKISDDSGDALDTGFRVRDIAKDIWMGINELDLQL